jgi:hypothetical protein
MRPFRFRPPIHLAAAGAMVVAGLASYQGVDHLVLAKTNHTDAGTEVGHEPTGSSTSTTVHHEPTGSSTSTTLHTEPPPPSTTSTTVHHEPTGSSTSTTIHHEPTGSSTSTTVHHEPTATTSTTKAPKPPTPPSVQTLSFGCITGTPSDGIPTARCGWSKSTSTNFHHYRLTRELVGTPRATIFTTENRDTMFFYDRGLQPGAEYSYIIEAYDGAGNLIGRGGPAHVTCCNGGTGTQ